MSGNLKYVSKKIVGTGSEKYLPYALSKLDALAQRYRGYPLASNTQVDDGTFIRIETRDGVSGSVLIIGGGAGYEFFTTGPVLKTGPSFTGFAPYRGYAVAAKVNVEDNTVKAKALGSTIDPAVDPLTMSQIFTHKNTWQIQGIPEHTFYPKWDGTGPRPFLIDSWVASSDIISLPSTAAIQFGVSAFDVLYDIRPTVYEDINKLEARGATPDADWYKRACVRTVKHPQYGSRQFVIMTDARSQFVVYPVIATEDVSLAIHSAYADEGIKTTQGNAATQTVPAPMPSWARKIPAQAARDFVHTPAGSPVDSTDIARLYPQYRWAFNSAGTRAAAIIICDLPAGGYPLASPGYTAYPDGFVMQRTGGNGQLYDLHATLPALLELDLQLELTGPNPEDFTFTLATLRADDPRVVDRYFVACDYQFATDHLLVMEGSVHFHPTPPIGMVYDGYLDVTDMQTGQQLHTFPVELGMYSRLTKSAKIIAYDLRMLGFVIEQAGYLTELSGNDAPNMQKQSRASNRLVTLAYGEVVRVQNVGRHADILAQLPAPDMKPIARAEPRMNQYFSGEYINYYGEFVDTFVYRSRTPADLEPFTDKLEPYVYLDLIARQVQPTAVEMFTVHPEGHWSVVTQASLVFEGPINAGYPYIGLSVPPTTTYAQDYVDIVRWKVQQKDGSFKFVDKSHIDLANQALGLNLKKEDFLFSVRFSVQQTPIYDTITAVAQAEFFFGGKQTGTIVYNRKVISSPGVDADPNDSSIPNYFNLCQFNPRAQSDYFFSTVSGQGQGNALYGGAQNFYYGLPILRGSSLLYGTLNKPPKATP